MKYPENGKTNEPSRRPDSRNKFSFSRITGNSDFVLPICNAACLRSEQKITKVFKQKLSGTNFAHIFKRLIIYRVQKVVELEPHAAERKLLFWGSPLVFATRNSQFTTGLILKYCCKISSSDLVVLVFTTCTRKW